MDVDAVMHDVEFEVVMPGAQPLVAAPMQSPTCAVCGLGPKPRTKRVRVRDHTTMQMREYTIKKEPKVPHWVPELGAHLHVDCALCANCGAEAVDWYEQDAAGCDAFAPSSRGELRKTVENPRRLLCHGCKRVCPCSDACHVAASTITADADWHQASKTAPWVFLPHRPCSECNQHCMHSAKPKRASPLPLAHCAVDRHCLHSGFLRIRSWNVPLRSKIPGGGFVSVCFDHLACLVCGKLALDDTIPNERAWLLTPQGPAHRNCLPCELCQDEQGEQNKFKTLARDPLIALPHTHNKVYHSHCIKPYLAHLKQVAATCAEGVGAAATVGPDTVTPGAYTPFDEPQSIFVFPDSPPRSSTPAAPASLPIAPAVREPVREPVRGDVVRSDTVVRPSTGGKFPKSFPGLAPRLACPAQEQHAADAGVDSDSESDSGSDSSDSESDQEEHDDDAPEDAPAPAPRVLTPPPTPLPRRPVTRSRRGRALKA
jgi:hypothetical protein